MLISVGKVVECYDGRLVRVTADHLGLPVPEMLDMRTFRLYRSDDPSGVSGVGFVAEGVQFTSGKCVLAWTTSVQSIAVYDSMADLVAIHGHDGKTSVRWLPTLAV